MAHLKSYFTPASNSVNLEKSLSNSKELLSDYSNFTNEAGSLKKKENVATLAREFPLSHAQQSLWFMARLVPDHPFYNLPSALRLRGILNLEALRRTFSTLVGRHEALRTLFPARDGKPVQLVLPALEVEIPLIQVHGANASARQERAFQLATKEGMRPFDLGAGPLMRVVVFSLEPEEHWLVFTMHHIVTDGWSIGVMSREIPLLYGAFCKGEPNPLPELSLQYGDYARRQRERLAGEGLESHLDYWRQRLKGARDMDLPTDFPRPAIQSHRGRIQYLEFPLELRDALDALAKSEGVTLFMLLLALFHLLLHRLSGQEETLVGTPMANREQREVEGLIGFFANSLVLPCNLRGNPNFRELVGRVREETLQAFAHREIPFEMLVEQLRLTRDPSRNPLFQVMFALQKSSVAEIQFPGLEVEPIRLDNPTTHFDMEWHLWNREDGLGGYVSYSQDLFEPLSVLRITSEYLALAKLVVANPELKLDQLEPQASWDRAWLLEKAQAKMSAPLGKAESQPSILAVLSKRWQEAQQSQDALWLAQVGGNSWRSSDFFRAFRSARATIKAQVPAGESVLWLADESPDSLAMACAAWSEGLALAPVEDEDRMDEWMRTASAVNATYILTVQAERQLPAGLRLITPCVGDFETKASVEEWSGSGPALWRKMGRNWRLLDQADLLEQAQEFGLTLGFAPGQEVAIAGFGPSSRLILELAALVVGALPLLSASKRPLTARELLMRKAACWILTPELAGQMLELEQTPQSAKPDQLYCMGALPSPALLKRLAERFERTPRLVYAPPECERVLAIQSEQEGLEEAALPKLQVRQGLALLDRAGTAVGIGVYGRIHVIAPAKSQESERLPLSKTRFFEQETAWVRTGEWARWRVDGSLELRGSSNDSLLWRGERLDLEELAEILSEEGEVEAQVSARCSETGWEPVAYMVPLRNPSRRDFEALVLSRLAHARRPETALLLSNFPRDPEGRVDLDGLHRFPIPEPRLLERWKTRIDAQPGVLKTHVALTIYNAPEKRLHLADLIEDWKAEETPLYQTQEQDQAQLAASLSETAAEARPSAYSSGGPLLLPEGAPLTLTTGLIETARRFPEKGIHCYQENGKLFVSYPELLQRAQRVLAGLRAAGLKPGERAILQLEKLADHFACFWGCALGGIIPVTVAIAPSYEKRNSVVNKLWNTWKLLRGPWVIHNQSLEAELARVPDLYREEGRQEPYRMLRAEALLDHEPDLNYHQAEPTDVLFYQLTSGSTGIPKCIQETHQGIIHHILGSALFNDYRAEDVNLNWLPMDHVVPILTCHLKDTYLGISQIHLRTPLVLADPLLWLKLIEAHRVTHTWAPNFGFKLVNDALSRQPERSFELSSLRFAMNAGEQVTLPVVAEWLRRLEPFGVRSEVMQPAFGMAECCTCMTYLNDFHPDSGLFWVSKASLGGSLKEAKPGCRESIGFVNLGPVMPGVEIRITDGDNQPLPEGVIGRFQIRGAVTTPGYLYNDEANREAFVGDGWFNSGDLGFIKNGQLALTGREKEIIIIRGANFYCYEIEDVVNSVSGVLPTFSAAIAVQDPATGSETLAVFFVAEADLEAKEGLPLDLLSKLRETVARDLGISPGFIIPIAKAAFPKTTSGKIQRTQLKKALAAGEFDKRLKEIDLALGNAHCLADQFFRKIWVRRELPASPVRGARARAKTLIFADQQGLALALSAAIQNEDADAAPWLVFPGEGFRALGAGQCEINPGSEADYQELFQHYGVSKGAELRLIHLWQAAIPASEDADSEMQLGAGFCLNLLRALKAHGLLDSGWLSLLSVASQSQVLRLAERANPARATLQALLKSAAREHARLRVRHIDMELSPSANQGIQVQRILAEIRHKGVEEELAYREGGRYVSALAPLPLSKPDPSAKQQTLAEDNPFRPLQNGFYLISGGLGGLGQLLARYLLKRYSARVLLLGRAALGEETQKAKELRELQSLGAIQYAQVDCGDPESIAAALKRQSAAWGEPAGAFHLAGSFEIQALIALDYREFRRQIWPKYEGMIAFRQALPENCPLLAFGSVNAFFAGATAGAYAAANRALEALVENEWAQGRKWTRSIAWSMWDELGMSAGYPLKEASKAYGFASIDARKGLLALRALLESTHTNSYYGLDASKPAIQRQLFSADEPPIALRQWQAWYSAKSDFIPASLSRLEIQDRFGRPTRCAVQQLDQLPLLADGSIDERALLSSSSQPGSRAPIAPQSSSERLVASIWCELLGLEQIDIHRSFFELGGQSVLLVQVHHRLLQIVKRELSVVDLLRYPTISALAKFIDREQKVKPNFEHANERALKQKMALRKPVRRPGK